MLLALALKNWRPIAILAAFAAVWLWHRSEVGVAFRAGVTSEQTKARIEAGKRITQMEMNDGNFRNLSAFERCRLFLRDSGLPEHHCEQR